MNVCKSFVAGYFAYGYARAACKIVHHPKVRTERAKKAERATLHYNTKYLPYKGETRNFLLTEHIMNLLMSPLFVFYHLSNDISALELCLRNEPVEKYPIHVQEHFLFHTLYEDSFDYVLR